MLVRQLHQTWESYGLRRDLSHEHAGPEANIPLIIRELNDRDIPQILGAALGSKNRRERLEAVHRSAHIAERIPTCYVAVDANTQRPCFMQWLMFADQNERIKRFFRGRFPLLLPDEALLENAYTPPEYRRKGIMSAAMWLVAEKARDRGCRYVVTFVSKDNSASLKACTKAGFHPFLMRRDSHSLFHLIRSRSFEPLPNQSAG
jgi:GNAT superfamily N-acetyltransferase